MWSGSVHSTMNMDFVKRTPWFMRSPRPQHRKRIPQNRPQIQPRNIPDRLGRQWSFKGTHIAFVTTHTNVKSHISSTL